MLLLLLVAADAGVLLLGPAAPLGPTLVLLVGAFAALALLGLSERRRRSLGRRPVLVAAAGLLGLAVAVPPTASNDVWSYAMYGRMVAHHHSSPYRHAPSEFPDDPWSDRVAERWRDSRSLYGPLFTGLSAGVMAVAGLSPLAARLLFQGLAALAVLSALVLVGRRSRDAMAMAFLGLNPVTVISVVNGGHNDALVGVGLLAGVLLAARRRPAWAGFAAALAALVKVAALLPLLAVAAWTWWRQGARAAAALVSAGAGTFALGCLLAGGPVVLAPLDEARDLLTGPSIWNHWADRFGAGPVPVLAALATLGLAAVLVRRELDRDDPGPAVGLSVLAYMLVGAYVLPWYLAWSLPALALCWWRGVGWLAAAQAALMQLTTLPTRGVSPFSRPAAALDPLQRLQLDVYRGVLPLLQVLAAVALVALAFRRRAPVAGPPLQETSSSATRNARSRDWRALRRGSHTVS